MRDSLSYLDNLLQNANKDNFSGFYSIPSIFGVRDLCMFLQFNCNSILVQSLFVSDQNKFACFLDF